MISQRGRLGGWVGAWVGERAVARAGALAGGRVSRWVDVGRFDDATRSVNCHTIAMLGSGHLTELVCAKTIFSVLAVCVNQHHRQRGLDEDQPPDCNQRIRATRFDGNTSLQCRNRTYEHGNARASYSLQRMSTFKRNGRTFH